ncbi:MAG: hypothetical protein KBC73_23080 [Burkholderiaceae bacterium]|nr:hypothetical protein [Burkholderiaceae bacterium]
MRLSRSLLNCHWCRLAIIGALLWALGGCSTVQVGYNQGPMLAWWWLDRQLDFDSVQKPRVQQALADWFAWHRRSQLADYHDELARLQRLVLQPTLAPAELCALVPAWQQRLRVAAEPLLAPAAELVRTLTPAQLDHLQRHLAEGLDDARREFLPDDAAERQQRALKRAVERYEGFYGSLDEAQQRLLAEALAQSPFDAQRWLAERRARQQALLQSLRQWQAERADAQTIAAGLRRLLDEMLVSPRPDYRELQRRNAEAGCVLTARLHASTSPAQRQKAAERLRRWQDDLRALQSRS